MFYFLVLINILFFAAWFNIEKPTSPTSRGISTLVIGCLMSSIGIVQIANKAETIVCLSFIFVGLLMAFYGTGRFIIYELRR
jgi:quinol-cytochrome oxidoreductase complex cytochrome b subunit